MISDPLDLDELLGAHVVQVTGQTSFHLCAQLEDRSLRCWGLVGDGRLGYGPLFEEVLSCGWGYGKPCAIYGANEEGEIPTSLDCCLEEGETLENLPPVPYE